MNLFHLTKKRFVFLCLAGLVALTGLTRISSEIYAYHSIHVYHPSVAMTRMEEDMAQMRDALVCLESADPVTRAHGAARLGLLGPKATCATSALSDALQDPDQHVRVIAAQSLGSIGRFAAPAIPKLIASIKDSDSELRFRAIESLGKIGPAARPALSALASVRTTGNGEEQSAAMLASNRIQYPQFYRRTVPSSYSTISSARIASPTAKPKFRWQVFSSPKRFDQQENATRFVHDPNP